MNIATKQDVLQLLKSDTWLMNIVLAAETLHLPDWWVCAGVIRSKIWDVLQGHAARSPVQDVDVIYFDPDLTNEREEKEHEAKLRLILPDVPWSVKNEARMHIVNNIPPYSSAVDAISKFPETVTALGVNLDSHGQLVLVAPHGIEDVLHFRVRPTPYFEETAERAHIYEARVKQKNWTATWSNVQVTHTNWYS